MQRNFLLLAASCAISACIGCSQERPAANVAPPAPAVDQSSTESAGTPDPKALAGQPAPPFQTKQLDGSDFSLDQLKGKVVMLDFWATWCPPCVAELPIILKLADEYADRGVVLYAVNAGEAPDEIKAFLTDKMWNLNVLLDQEASVGKKYGVDSIPLLLLIDREGVVRKVELGYHPGAEEALRKELDELTAQAASPPPQS